MEETIEINCKKAKDTDLSDLGESLKKIGGVERAKNVLIDYKTIGIDIKSSKTFNGRQVPKSALFEIIGNYNPSEVYQVITSSGYQITKINNQEFK